MSWQQRKTASTAGAGPGATGAPGASRAAAGLRWRSASRWGCAPPLTPLHAGDMALVMNLIPPSGRGAARGSGWKGGTAGG